MKFSVLNLLLFLLSMQFSFSQCDCPGNVPPPMIVISGPINNGKIMLSEDDISLNLSFRHSYGDKLLVGDVSTTSLYNTKYTFDYLGILAIYGLSNRINLEAETGYFSSKVTNFYQTFNSDKFSHLGLSAKYNLFDNSFTDEWIIGLGVKFPLNNQEIDTSGIDDPKFLKPANSSMGIFLSSIYNLSINDKMNLLFNAKYDINFKDNDESKFGNIISGGITYRYKFSSATNFAFGLSYEHRAKDFYHNSEPTNSGGNIVMISPNLTYKFDFPMYFNFALPYPLYQYYNGAQSALTYSFIISAGFGF
jgi:hypothetical protein